MLHPTGQSVSFLPTGDTLCPLDVLEGSQANIGPVRQDRRAELQATRPCLPVFLSGKSPRPTAQIHSGDSRDKVALSTRSPR